MDNKLKIGFSSAASWAWGTSLIMGQQIAQERGLTAWVIWAFFNSLTLAVFGLLYRKKYIDKSVCDRKELKIIALVIQFFCLIVQLNFINQQLSLLTGSSVIAYALTVGIGCASVLIVYRHGLPTSIATDVWQWIGAMVAIVAIIEIGAFTGAEPAGFAKTETSSVLWGLWSGLILMAGPIGDVQHWQRAETDKTGKGYYIGAVAFGVYMLMILGMARYEFSPLMNTILLVAVLCVTTSTIDSIAVALHEVGNKKIGTAVALILCAVFGVVVKVGIVDLWSAFGVVRVAFAGAILLLPLCVEKKRGAVPLIALTFSCIMAAVVLGLAPINNVFGIVSFALSCAVLLYLVITYMRAEKC